MWQVYLKFFYFMLGYMLDGFKSGSGTGLHCGSGSAKESCRSDPTTLLTITPISAHYHKENLRAWFR
jgi:hypothetical protein